MGTRILKTSRTFAPSAESVREARRFARAALEEWGLENLVDDSVLLVSELVTNAITHAGTAATLEVRLDAGGVRLGVEDLHPGLRLPMGAGADPQSEEHGRGLLVTSTLSAAWGVEYLPHSKRVWAVLALNGEPDDPSVLAPEVPSPVVPDDDNRRRAPAAVVPDQDPLGLRGVALNRLSLDDLQALVVEQVRERIAGDASYLLLAQGLEERFTVTAVSGLPADVRGRTIDPGQPGAPGIRSPFSPVSMEDLREHPVDFLSGSDLGSLVLAPLVFDGRVIGALATARAGVGAFSEDDAALLQRAADWVASAVDRARLKAAEVERRGWLGFLADAGALLAGSLDPEMTVTMIGQIVVPRLATWCGVYVNDSRGQARLHHAWHSDEERLAELNDALARARPDASGVPAEPVLDGEVTNLPLEARGGVIGWLTLGRADRTPLRGELRTVAEAFTLRAALAIDSALAHAELHEIGDALQQSLLPASLPVVPGIDIGVVYEPAGEYNEAGGDFYDIFPLGNGRWCFVVGDVCGTGPEAAGVTGLARHTVRALMRSGFPIATTLERLNDAILEEGDRARFLTLVCGTLEATDNGHYRIRLVCAGHPPPFHVTTASAPAGVRRIGRPQTLLGVVEAVDYIEEEYRLPRGDRLVVVTDGVLERRDGPRTFDDEGCEEALAASAGVSAQTAASRLAKAVADFSASPSADDLAVLILDLASIRQPSEAPGQPAVSP